MQSSNTTINIIIIPIITPIGEISSNPNILQKLFLSPPFSSTFLVSFLYIFLKMLKIKVASSITSSTASKIQPGGPATTSSGAAATVKTVAHQGQQLGETLDPKSTAQTTMPPVNAPRPNTLSSNTPPANTPTITQKGKSTPPAGLKLDNVAAFFTDKTITESGVFVSEIFILSVCIENVLGC